MPEPNSNNQFKLNIRLNDLTLFGKYDLIVVMMQKHTYLMCITSKEKMDSNGISS